MYEDPPPTDQPTPAPTPSKTSDDLDIPESRRNLVTEWQEKIVNAREHWTKKGVYKQMRENMEFAARGADKEWMESGKYVVPILPRHINQAVAKLYARNPTTVAKRRRKLLFKLWDGRLDSLKAAMEMAATAMDPNALAIVQEVSAAQQTILLFNRIGKTLEVLFEYYLNEQEHDYKQQLKAAIRRAKVTKVGYIKIGFQRILEQRPEITAQITDSTRKLAEVEGILACMADTDSDYDETSAEVERLRLLTQDLQSQETITVREGLVFDFPRSSAITIDPNTVHLKTLAGASWVAQLYEMTPQKVRQVYKVDLKQKYTRYDENGRKSDAKDDKCKCRVHEIWDRDGMQWLTICEGYPDFLKEPADPDLKIERFYPIFPIVFNETEDAENPYPPADVEQAKHIQLEYNRSREAMRQHRIAARPWYVASGRIEEEERKKIAHHADHEVVVLPSLADGEKVEDFVQRGPTAPIDPNLYEVEMHYSDLLRVVGSQEANLGGTSGSTATESSIAENSTSTADDDLRDDIDSVLTLLARAGSQILLTEMSKDAVIEIVGEGAVWPDSPMTKEEVAKDLYLEIKAGSSGRPNAAADAAKLERVMPMMLQIPGVNPAPLIDGYANLLEIDPEELHAEGMPSITAMNAILAKQAPGMGAPGGEPTGDPRSDPTQQGPQGAQNAPNPATNEPGPQPGYPAPMA